MSEFDRENEDVFQIVHDNPRRRGVIRDIGYIVPIDKAQRFAAYEAAQKRQSNNWRVPVMLMIEMLIIIGITVAVLI